MDAIWTELYNAAKAVLKPRNVSSLIEAGRHAGRFDAGVADIKRLNDTAQQIKKRRFEIISSGAGKERNLRRFSLCHKCDTIKS